MRTACKQTSLDIADSRTSLVNTREFVVWRTVTMIKLIVLAVIGEIITIGALNKNTKVITKEKQETRVNLLFLIILPRCNFSLPFHYNKR